MGLSGRREPPSRNLEVKYTGDCRFNVTGQRLRVRQQARKGRLEQQVRDSSCFATIRTLFHGGR